MTVKKNEITIHKDALTQLGEDLRGLRRAQGLTLEDLAEASGKSVSFLSKIERGLARPSVTTLQELADSLGVSVGWFFEAGDPIPEDELYTHIGEEAGLIINGQIDLHLDGKVFQLETGDSFSFSASLPHRYSNSGDGEAQIVWANTPVNLRR